MIEDFTTYSEHLDLETEIRKLQCFHCQKDIDYSEGQEIHVEIEGDNTGENEVIIIKHFHDVCWHDLYQTTGKEIDGSGSNSGQYI